MPVIILGGIYGSVFTPTEAAAVSVVYGLFVGMVIYKEVKFKDLFGILIVVSKNNWWYNAYCCCCLPFSLLFVRSLVFHRLHQDY